MVKPEPGRCVASHEAVQTAMRSVAKPATKNLTADYVAAVRCVLQTAGVIGSMDASDRRVRDWIKAAGVPRPARALSSASRKKAMPSMTGRSGRQAMLPCIVYANTDLDLRDRNESEICKMLNELAETSRSKNICTLVLNMECNLACVQARRRRPRRCPRHRRKQRHPHDPTRSSTSLTRRSPAFQPRWGLG